MFFSSVVMIHEPAVLIEGVLFRAKYLGSTQIICDGRPTKASRMMQAQEAVTRIKVLIVNDNFSDFSTELHKADFFYP